MTIYNYLTESAQRSGTGVARFAQMLKRAIPEIKEVSREVDFTQVAHLESVDPLYPGDVVITDNHLSLEIPDGPRVIAVHHGSADAHYKRDATWRNKNTLKMVVDQEKMYARTTEMVSPSMWVMGQFDDFDGTLIPHWVDSIPQLPKRGKPIVIGDWRDNNKGAGAWKKLAEANPQWDFKPLNFRTEADKLKQYGEASLYLCLSLSEGGSYSMCDAEAARLPIVSTNVGNYLEFSDCAVIRWQDRDNLKLVSDAIERKLNAGRKSCFYDSYSFEDWRAAWLNVIR